MEKQETLKKRGIVKQILKDHLHGFWELHANRFPKELQEAIPEAVKKATRCCNERYGLCAIGAYGLQGRETATRDHLFTCM